MHHEYPTNSITHTPLTASTYLNLHNLQYIHTHTYREIERKRKRERERARARARERERERERERTPFGFDFLKHSVHTRFFSVSPRRSCHSACSKSASSAEASSQRPCW